MVSMKLNTLEVYGIAVFFQVGKAGISVPEFNGAFEFLESWNSMEGMEATEKI